MQYRGEQGYLDLLREILENGDTRENRTDIGTISLFGKSMKFDLTGGKIPLMTTKKMSWEWVAKELLWIISGDTNSRTLSAQGVKIWDANGSREFLDSVGLQDNEVGDLGPIYGHQWRNFNSEGVDQLKGVIDGVRNDPFSRRHVVSAWNPAQIKKMAVPPCHMMFQFYVSSDQKYLDCMMYQRSGDMFLGVPYNVFSYSLLTHIVAKLCGMEAREFTHVIGDAHIYSNHVEQCKKQMGRDVREMPRVDLDMGEIRDIDDIAINHIRVSGYDPHPFIKGEMAV